MRLFLFHLRSQSDDYFFNFEWYCNEWRISFPSDLVASEVFLHILSLPKIYEPQSKSVLTNVCNAIHMIKKSVSPVEI